MTSIHLWFNLLILVVFSSLFLFVVCAFLCVYRSVSCFHKCLTRCVCVNDLNIFFSLLLLLQRFCNFKFNNNNNNISIDFDLVVIFAFAEYHFQFKMFCFFFIIRCSMFETNNALIGNQSVENICETYKKA